MIPPVEIPPGVSCVWNDSCAHWKLTAADERGTMHGLIMLPEHTAAAWAECLSLVVGHPPRYRLVNGRVERLVTTS